MQCLSFVRQLSVGPLLSQQLILSPQVIHWSFGGHDSFSGMDYSFLSSDAIDGASFCGFPKLCLLLCLRPKYLFVRLQKHILLVAAAFKPLLPRRVPPANAAQ